MQFKDIFARPVDRHMDPVIKSDDAEHLADELEEYVLTPDVRRSLQRFCDEYNDPNSAGNGAWISGFYGSGKSHLLKMLSHMLENEEVAGRPALDYMKPKLGSDAMLAAALARACEQMPSESILFNVGGKSDSQRRDSGESLLNAFIKVLNERCGYFAGEQAHVAALERDLDRAGLLGAFTSEVESATGRSWEQVRSNPLIFGEKASAAYDRVCGQAEGTTPNVFHYYAETYHPTPEDFAGWVADYIEKREKDQPGFRLNFFADEMGQYIAGSVPLLQMLQDIVEQLNTKCGRRAWVVVVSQEDMGSMADRLGKQSSAGEFSKIQARFRVLIKIPANDSNTVVKERLLEKDAEAIPAIDKLYDDHSGEFAVKLDFPDGATKYKPYDGHDDFTATYPLVGYQFTLFHQALTGLSDHDAFTGQYVSTGARNMLGATHRVLVARKDSGCVERGDLIPFDAMFEGLRDELKSEVFGAVSMAEDHFGDPLGTRVLEALLLVKYVKGFKATPTNLSVLLCDGLECDQAALKEKVSAVCDELARQTYIRRNGDAYEYLTDDEKDVESEIKREPVTNDQIKQQIGKLLSEVVGQTKVKYLNANFSEVFAYDLMVDGVAAGSQRSELKVSVLTDFTPEADANYKYAPVKNLYVALPRNTRLTQDVQLWIQTNSYVGLNQQAEGRRATIVAEKRSANETLRREIMAELRDELNDALWGACMDDIGDAVKGQGADRVGSAVQELIRRSYPHLRMLDEPFDPKGVYRAATGFKLMLDESLPEYCGETLIKIGQICGSTARCVVGGAAVNSLEASLRAGDHGWPVEAVRQAVGILALNGKVECLRNDEPLEGAALASALSQGTHLESVEVRPAIGASQEQLDALRAAYRDVSGMDAPQLEANALADKLSERLRQIASDAKADTSARRLPFAAHYAEQAAKLEQVAAHKRDWFVQNAGAERGAMAACVKDIEDMRKFANGRPGVIFAEVASFLDAQAANIDAVPECAEKAEEARQILANPECYKESSAPKAKQAANAVREAVEAELAAARKKAKDDLASFSMSFRASDDYRAASQDAKGRASAIIASCDASIDAEGQIVTLRGMVESFKANRATELYQAVAPAPAPNEGDGDDTPRTPAVTTVPFARAIPARYRNRTLSTQADVDAFVDALRAELQARVSAGDKVIL
ncbi:BREX system P-loop protein BrxC [Paratractidigestivibacter sp.]|uniref:BREX system P-loop protein BrxC n=1 Tax=Paratractidigestivibacter sp. TaxID=2847316 RepID=UPI002ACB161A|nr:BREX system P-loop protein BrxC [Paratractidigestivibacter sp.]